MQGKEKKERLWGEKAKKGMQKGMQKEIRKKSKGNEEIKKGNRGNQGNQEWPGIQGIGKIPRSQNRYETVT